MNVGQSPQRSVTTSSTVAGWPGVTRWMESATERCGVGSVIGAAETVLTTPTPGTSTVALASRVNRSARIWLFGMQPVSAAVNVDCRRPGVLVATCTATLARGVGVLVGGAVAVGVL